MSRHKHTRIERLRRHLIKLALVVIVLFGLFAFAVPAYLGPQNGLRKASAIVAISGGDTTARAKEAIKLYKEGWAPQIIFSGAAKDPSSPSNADIMSRQAVAAGIPLKVVDVEGSSDNTEENAQDTASIIKADNYRTIILVTSPYHQRRAEVDFRHYLGSKVAIINRSSVDNNDWAGWTWWLHEQSLAIGLGEVLRTTFVLVQYHARI
ncbi:MAG TPA: YdcF family protein [Candidatus Saccharimonadales bacterium]|nr:YdcF family protein [Candidatus Saccharimonadales bacterium]